MALTNMRPRQVTSILAVDPGVTTGLAWTTPECFVHLHRHWNTEAIKAESLRHPDPNVLFYVARQPAWDFVVVEKFATAGLLSKYGLYTIELVGAISALAWQHGCELVVVSPQHRMACLDKAAQLKGHASYAKVPKPASHEVDALAHLLVALEHHAGVVL